MLKEVARGRAGQQAAAQHRQVDPGPHAHGEHLGGRDEVREPEQVDHQLDRVARPVAADVQDPAWVAHRGQQRPDPCVVFSRAADEYLKGASVRRRGHTADGRVQHADAERLGQRADPAGDRRNAGGHVHPDGAGRQPRQQPVGAEQHLLHLPRRRQHRDDHGPVPARLRGRACPGRAGGDQGGRGAAAHIVDDEVMARRQDVAAHRLAHVTQADESHLHRLSLSAHRATASWSISAPRPGRCGTFRHPSESISTGSVRKKSRRCSVQPGGS